MQLPESATGTVVGLETQTTIQSTKRHYSTLSKSDPYLIERLVGFHEYSHALNYLDRLVRMCDRYELEAVEDIVRAEPEFAIYTLSADRSSQTASSDRKDFGAGTRNTTRASESSGGHKRHGLKWITALARVELGAMYAGFSESPQPFSHVVTPGYDASEFRALLGESARVHYWALDRDPIFRSLTKRFRANSMTLAYLRRLNIATAFALASGQFSSQREANNIAEMSRYAKNLNDARTAIQVQITAYLAQVRLSKQLNTIKSGSQLTLTELCNNGICRQFSQPNDTSDADKKK